MTEKEIENWEKLRAEGKFKFVFSYGILRWALPVSIFWFIGMNIFSYLVESETFFTNIVLIIITFLIWLIGGIFYGMFIWYWNEKRFFKVSEN